MSDQFDYYRAALAGKNPAIHEGQPQSGFYYARAGKRGGRIPVAIWTAEDGEKNFRWGHKADHVNFTEQIAAQRWTWIADKPVKREDYVTAWTDGVWADGTPCVEPPAGVGDNSSGDPFADLKGEIDDKLESARAFAKANKDGVTDKTGSDKAANLAAELAKLNKRADDLFEDEKKPVREKAAEIDKRYAFRKDIATAVSFLKALASKWMKAEEDRLLAEERKRKDAEERAIAIARAEREKLMQNDPIAALTSPEPELPMPAKAEPVKVQAGGGFGAKLGLRDNWIGIITDWPKALDYYKDHPDVRAAVEKLVKAEVKLKKDTSAIPGVEAKNERKAA